MKKPKEPLTPFERMIEFTRRIVAVPKAEVEKRMKSIQPRKKSRWMHTP